MQKVERNWVELMSPGLFWDVEQASVDPQSRNFLEIYIDNRRSIDLDFFSVEPFDSGRLYETIADVAAKKYNGNRFLVIRSLLWFDDAEREPDPVFLNGWSWRYVRDEVKSLVSSLVTN